MEIVLSSIDTQTHPFSKKNIHVSLNTAISFTLNKRVYIFCQPFPHNISLHAFRHDKDLVI